MAFLRQAVACAAAVAAYGRTAYADRASIRALRGAASCPQSNLLADVREPQVNNDAQAPQLLISAIAVQEDARLRIVSEQA